MPKATKITVKGKVQGVYYRASTREKATELKVNGWCKNLPNGDVQIHAEGDSDSIEELIQWCHQGPTYAVVTEVLTEEVNSEGFETFSIQWG
ncbi:acylphosphatase [Roseivirga sp.]|uniref:acylphosphatase n=1 Tax=Roseivirga sp. TaxID=1964215 RepID=UPI003B5160CE